MVEFSQHLNYSQHVVSNLPCLLIAMSLTAIIQDDLERFPESIARGFKEAVNQASIPLGLMSNNCGRLA